MTSENLKLNPQKQTVEIGIRKLRGVTIYPLSVADQLEMTDLITQTIREFFAKRDEMVKLEESDEPEEKKVALVSFIVGLIRDNVLRMLTLVTDAKELGKDPLKDISNVQFFEIADIIYAVNYEAVSKNAQNLFEKIKKLFPSKRSLQESVKDIHSIDSKTSTESPGETEDLPSDS